jgi:ribosome maturation factor RimP
MIDSSLIKSLALKYLEDKECYLVDVTVSSDNRIVVEIDSDTSVSIDFCIAMSRHIESELNRDVEDFELEVGSSGLTEPFKLVRQYTKNIGNEVEVLTCDGRKLKGVLLDANEENFLLETERDVKLEGAKRKTRIKEEERFNYQDIKYTKYLIRFK